MPPSGRHWANRSEESRAVRDLKRSTLRNYQDALRSFSRYLTDPAYGWAAECEGRFGPHPIQVIHEWNSAVHVQEAEPTRRAFTLEETQAFLDYADDQVTAVHGQGRKGWLPAFRDATLFKVAYAYGLRRPSATAPKSPSVSAPRPVPFPSPSPHSCWTASTSDAITRMLNYTDQQTSRTASDAGACWSRSAPGDHDG
ncbi:hypothetical protein ACSNOI_30045 [Actinomadura kijaniata]|uniref:hypothetical protein n=1 Tax=Actinomadura kijaniata TaxID=46161 RepID=UPI003F1B975B